MMWLEDFSAVLTSIPPAWPSSKKVRCVRVAEEKRHRSPAAAYALEACSLLDQPLPQAMVCISGSTGSTVEAFDAAHEPGATTLVTEGFVRRSRRIHPMTLLRSIQNQVPAILSIELGLQGPCLNIIESGMPHALVHVASMLKHASRVLMVMSSAGFRVEEKSRHLFLHGDRGGLEGALCLVLSSEAGLGRVSTDLQRQDEGHAFDVGPLALKGGMELISAVLLGERMAAWCTVDGASLCWEAAS